MRGKGKVYFFIGVGDTVKQKNVAKGHKKDKMHVYEIQIGRCGSDIHVHV